MLTIPHGMGKYFSKNLPRRSHALQSEEIGEIVHALASVATEHYKPAATYKLPAAVSRQQGLANHFPGS